MATQQDAQYEVVSASGYTQAHFGVCLHPDCQQEDGVSMYRTRRQGSEAKAASAVRDHLRDVHGVGR